MMLNELPCLDCGERHQMSTAEAEGHSMHPVRRCPNVRPPGHTTTYVDSEGGERCECGKWLEPGYYEMDDHLRNLT